MLVGRAEDAPVRLLDPQASRRHAVIHVGTEIEIEDLGSANGTRLRDVAIEAGRRHRLLPGDAVSIGDTILTLQRRERTPLAGEVSPHASFEGRLIEECARAESVRRSFAVLRIQVDVSSAAAEVVGVIRRSLRPGDVLGAYGPSQYEALLPDSGQTESEAVNERVGKALSEAGVEARTGLACYPADGTSPQALIARAGARVFGTQTSEVVDVAGMVLRNQGMRELYQLAERAAATSINVLILGETGVGKEVLAQAIHNRSPRVHRPLLSINCAALSETLLESELFGHEQGAFTGALRSKPGLLETADGGTVFLDEVGEMSGSLQAKLLRAIESKKVLRVGGTRPIARSTCGFSRPPTATSTTRWLTIPFARTSISDSTACHSSSRPCANASTRSSRSPGISSSGPRSSSGVPLRRSPPTRWRFCGSTPGRATSGSCAT